MAWHSVASSVSSTSYPSIYLSWSSCSTFLTGPLTCLESTHYLFMNLSSSTLVHVSNIVSFFHALSFSPVFFLTLLPCLSIQSTCSCTTFLTCTSEVYFIQQRVHLYPIAVRPQRTRPPSWWQIRVELYVCHARLLHVVICDMQTEDVGVPVPQRPLPEHQVHAILACCCGIQVQNQWLVVMVYCRPALMTYRHTKHHMTEGFILYKTPCMDV